jgi:cytochrome c-type biogenesis protein CcmH
MTLNRAATIISLAALATACGGEKAPSPGPPPSAAPGRGGLRPLTSRDIAPEPRPGPPQGLPPGHPPIGGGAPQTGAGDRPVSGTLTLSPGLASRAAAARALFIVARDSATQQIVAVRKEQEIRFPLRFSISGEDAMTKGTGFTGPFDLTARLSKTGDAAPGAGDVEGQAKGVKAGASGVAITLDRVRQ